MRDLADLRAFGRTHADQPLILCTLIRKEHYGYRSVGAKKIVSRSGAQCGLLSGGCLESEIVQTAIENWDVLPLVKSFSTLSETDRFFGYQTGCPGVIDVLFERISPSIDFDLYVPWGLTPKAGGVAVSWSAHDVTRVFQATPEDANFFDPWIHPIQLNIVGCGPDAPIYTEFAASMGWELRFFDYQEDGAMPAACGVIPEIASLDTLADQIPDGPLSAVVLMTHNYEADMTIMRHLADRNFGYVGCLGPRRRHEQMMADLKKLHGISIPASWQKTLHAPAGLFTSGRSPEDIALSIVAQIQSLLRPHEKA